MEIVIELGYPVHMEPKVTWIRVAWYEAGEKFRNDGPCSTIFHSNGRVSTQTISSRKSFIREWK